MDSMRDRGDSSQPLRCDLEWLTVKAQCISRQRSGVCYWGGGELPLKSGGMEKCMQ